MGTEGGFAALLNDSVNAQFKKILDAWGTYLRSPPSAYVLGKDPRHGCFGRDAREAMPPAVPVFIAQSTSDGVVLANSIALLQDKWCKAGSALSVLWLEPLATGPNGPLVTHGLEATVSGPAATAWIQDRFNSLPAPNTCDVPPHPCRELIAKARLRLPSERVLHRTQTRPVHVIGIRLTVTARGSGCGDRGSRLMRWGLSRSGFARS